MGENKTYGGFSGFYPFYLSQHRDRTCRRLHFAGTTLGLIAAHPLYSFMGDWVMWKDMLTGRIPL